MKKQILLIATITISSFAFAQSRPSFGIQAGVASSSMKGEAVNSLNNILEVTDGLITTKNRTGMYASANVAIPVSDKISIQPGIGYTQKGYELQGSLDLKGVEFLGVNARAQLQSHYIDMPVVVKANLNGLQLFAGPQISYLSKADLKTTAGVLGFNLLKDKFDVTDEFNRWDAGITGGIGYQFKNGFNVTASYDHGLSKVDANKSADSYNRSFKVGVGFNF